MALDDFAHDSAHNSKKMQTTTESEQKIAEKAAAALRVLEQKNALDLAEALGLSKYLEAGHHGC